jgi:hypothetical protein
MFLFIRPSIFDKCIKINDEITNLYYEFINLYIIKLKQLIIVL